MTHTQRVHKLSHYITKLHGLVAAKYSLFPVIWDLSNEPNNRALNHRSLSREQLASFDLIRKTTDAVSFSLKNVTQRMSTAFVNVRCLRIFQINISLTVRWLWILKNTIIKQLTYGPFCVLSNIDEQVLLILHCLLALSNISILWPTNRRKEPKTRKKYNNIIILKIADFRTKLMWYWEQSLVHY